MKTLQPIAFLLVFLSIPLFRAEADEKENLLAFVPDQVSQFNLFRPAKILSSKAVGEFRKVAGRNFERIADRTLNQYFKFGLAELEDIDAIIDASWTVSSEVKGNKSWDHYSIKILRTRKDHQDKFDLATHAVKNESEFEGKSILEMKIPLDGKFGFACILDERTIVWSSRKEAIRQSISAGESGPAKSEFFKVWKKLEATDIMLFLRADEFNLRIVPEPMKAWKKMQWSVAGIDLAKTVKIEMHSKFENNKAATAVKENTENQLEFLNAALQRTPSNPMEQVTLEIGKKLLANAKVKNSQDRIKIVTQVKLDLKRLVEPLGDMYEASKRTEAANHLRQNSLALLNFASAFGNLPPSVLTHESGKKYSWRIAILPFVGRNDIYDRYDFTQEWNSPHNLEVTSEMPDFFRSDTDDKDSTNASFFMLVGPGGAFDQNESTSFMDFRDGTSNTMTIIEAKRDVHWAKPEDIMIDPEQPLPKFGGFHKGGFNVGMGDGSVRFVSEDVAAEILREYFTPNGMEIPRPLDPAKSETDSGDDN